MDSILEAIGLTSEELQTRVVDRIAKSLMTSAVTDTDDEGEEFTYVGETQFAKTMRKLVKERIDAKVAEIAERTVLPGVGELIENYTLQATNVWGEKTGQSLTFIEYLTQRADAYLREEVDSDGHSKEEARGSWYGGKQKRIAFMIHKHLHYHISQAMTNALRNVTSSIAASLEETVKIKLAEAVKGLSVKTEIRT